MQNEYAVRGITEGGLEVWYTGKAGQGFTSHQMCDAFTYSTLECARRRAKMLNVGTPIHGIHFMVPVGATFGSN